MKKLFVVVPLAFLLTSCNVNRIRKNSELALSNIWKSDPCGTLGYRYTLCEYFLQTRFVDENFKNEKKVRFFFGSPDSIRHSLDLKNVYIYEYVVIGQVDCNIPEQHRLIQSSMEIYFDKKNKKIRSISFPIY